MVGPGRAWSPGGEASSRARRGVFLVFAVLNIAFLALDLAIGAGPAAVAARLLGSAIMAGTTFALGRSLTPNHRAAVINASGAGVVGSFVILAWVTGGKDSHVLNLLAFLPMMHAIAIPDHPRALFASGAVSTIGAIAILVTDGADPRMTLYIGFAAASCAAYATLSGWLYRRMEEREHATATLREDALARLAESERQRNNAERLATLGRLAAGVAHEIKNPLTYLKTNVDYLTEQVDALRDKDGERDTLDALKESATAVKHIEQIVADLRALSRDHRDGNRPIDVRAALEQALRLARPRLAGCELDAQLADGMPTVVANSGRLVQVFLNLVVNAAEAAAEGRSRRAPHVSVRARRTEDAVIVEVEDSGPGLSAEAATRLFQAFFTTKGEAGTGLGLALSREYVRQFNGELEGGNTANGGAIFTVRLPAALPAPVVA